jgi:hypothetical protein
MQFLFLGLAITVLLLMLNNWRIEYRGRSTSEATRAR